jgi:hypothetical protein
MGATPRPLRPDDDPLVKAAKEAALEIVRATARRRPWQAKDTADALNYWWSEISNLIGSGVPDPAARARIDGCPNLTPAEWAALHNGRRPITLDLPKAERLALYRAEFLAVNEAR